MDVNVPTRHVIQNGETLSSISQKYGFSELEIRNFHNQNAPLKDLIGTTDNFTNNGQLTYILIPPKEETSDVNSYEATQADETEEELTQENQTFEEQTEEQQEEPSKGQASEHDQKYLVIQKGLCVCDQSIPPNQVPVQFKVDSHKLQHANGDTSEHLIVTEEDVFFQKSSQPFGPQCKLQPNSSSYNPCSYTPAGKWQKTYEKIKVMDKKILTELSELQCSFGGKITVFRHGQTQEVTNAHFGNVELEELQAISPLVEKPELETPLIDQIQAKLPEQNNKTQAGNSKYKNPVFKKGSSDGVAEIKVRVDESVEFSVIKYKNEAKANKSKVSWKVLKGFDWIDETAIQFSDFGEDLKVNFDEVGKYRVFAFGSEDKVKQADNRCAIDVHVVINKLNSSTKGIKEIGDNFNGKSIRKGFPINFQPDFEMSATEEELTRVEMGVKDAQGNIVESEFSSATGLIFTPLNAIKYKVWVRYTQQDGTVQTFEKQYEAMSNSVQAIKAEPEAQKYREGSIIEFTAAKMRFSPLENDPDYARVKWNVNNVTAPERGKTFRRRFDKEGSYVVEVFMNSADGKGDDTFTVNIVKNIPQEFVGGNKVNWIVGKVYEVEIKTLLSDYDYRKDGKVIWTSSPSLIVVDSKDDTDLKIKLKATSKGVFQISANLGGKKIAQTVNANFAEIKRWCITDKDLDFKSDAGWGEELYAVVETSPILAGEKIHLYLLEKDRITADNFIKDLSEVPFDENGIAKVKFTTEEIKTELGKLVGERNKYQLYIAAKPNDGGIEFADMSRKNRGGKDTVYPATTVSHSELEKGKFTYIDSKKDITSVRFLKPNGKDAYEVIKYGDPIKVKVQTRNLNGTKLTGQMFVNLFANGLHKAQTLEAKEVKDETVEWDLNTADCKEKIAKSQTNRVSFWQVEVTEEKSTGGETVQHPPKTARKKNGELDWQSLLTYQSLKLSDVGKTSELAKTNAPLIIGEPLEPTQTFTGTCVCKDYDLIWGSKVSCEFRKKVVEISKKLGLPQENNEGANWLMAVMALETIGTFDHTKHNGIGYYGLIQFGADAAATLNTTTDKLIKMSAVEQLDYVEKHISIKKSNIKCLTDVYLSVLLPNLTGKGNDNNYVLWTNNREAYYNNPAFHKEEGEWENKVDSGKKDKNGNIIYKRGYDKNVEAKTYMWEVRKEIESWYDKGKDQKAKTFSCSSSNTNGDSNPEENEFGLVQVTKLGNPYIINYGTEDSYSYKKKDGSMSPIGQHGDDWMKPEKAKAFSDAVYNLVKEYPNQKIHLNDCSAYNPAYNLGHSANGGHSRGDAFDCKFLTVNGSGTNSISNLTSEDIKINARFVEILKETGHFSKFYTDGGKIPGSSHASGHKDHLHGN